MNFSDRTNWKLTPNAIASKLEELRRSGTEVLDLTESNPTRCDFEFPKNKLISALAKEQNISYMPSAEGIDFAREAVRDYYAKQNSRLKRNQILLTASTSEAYSFLFRLLTNPGDNVLFPQPSYPLFEFLVQLNDIRFETYPLVFDNRWKIDFNELRQRINDKTKAIVCVNPNNPTGNYIKTDELEKLNKICRDHNCALICDEVFFDYCLENKGISLNENESVLTFVLGGLSKSLAMPQMKVSWMIVNGPKDIVDSALERLSVITDTYLSVNTPSQNALEEWFSLQDDIQEQILARLKTNCKYLREHLSEDIGRLFPCEGGWYATLRLNKVIDEEQFVLEMLDKEHVYIHPGYYFDFTVEPVLVLSLLTAERIFQAGVKRLVGNLKAACLL